jgi:hypothetical protein
VPWYQSVLSVLFVLSLSLLLSSFYCASHWCGGGGEGEGGDPLPCGRAGEYSRPVVTVYCNYRIYLP